MGYRLILFGSRATAGLPEYMLIVILIKACYLQIADQVLGEVAVNNPDAANMSLLKNWCETEMVPVDHPGDPIYPHVQQDKPTKIIGVKQC